MPIVLDEMRYRRLQRELGEVQVALKLTLGVMRGAPGIGGLERACEGLLEAKRELMGKVMEMEG